jgi:hypothetical protein
MFHFTCPGLCPELGILYWNLCVKEKHDRKFPWWRDALPFINSYVTGWKNSIIKGKNKIEIRKAGVDIGILKISNEIRNILKEWYIWHKNNRINKCILMFYYC